jgi:hypothetical protein
LTHSGQPSANFCGYLQPMTRLSRDYHPQREIMHNSDYYREQADYYRQLAAAAENADAKQEFLELAEACEEAADRMDDCRARG